MPLYKLVATSSLTSQSGHMPRRPSFAHPSWFSIITPVLVGVASNVLADNRNDPIVFLLSLFILCSVSVLADFAGRYVTYRIKRAAWQKKRRL